LQDYSTFIKDTFDRYKCKERFEPLKCIPVYGDEGKLCAYLRPITADFKTTLPECPMLLTKWREENPTISTGTFEPTVERTENWLSQYVIGRDDRLLFLIMCLNGGFLGHIGFSSFDFAEKSCEIDAVLRGVKNLLPGLMTFSMHSLVYWGIRELHLEKILLKVFSDNRQAIRFYEKFGFCKVGEIPLVLVKASDEEKWEIAPEGCGEEAGRYYTEMRLDIDRWKEQFLIKGI